MSGEEDTSEVRQRRSRTYQLEMRRAVAAGVLETSAATFLLLIAVQHSQAGATAKALLVTGGPLGLLLSPLAVSLTRKMRWKAATGAALASWTGCAAFGVATLFGDLRVFVPACMIGVMSLTMRIPMLTQIYQRKLFAAARTRRLRPPRSILRSCLMAAIRT